jgi:hypothetical protein
MSDPADVPDLYRLAFIPGVFRCPKCDFELSKQTMCVATGNIGTHERDRQSEECPNDGTWMVPVTYQERVAQYADLFEETLTALELAVQELGHEWGEDLRLECNRFRELAKAKRKI